jgi:hypothetical protein
MAAALAHMADREYEVAARRVLSLVADSPCSAYDCEFVALTQELGVALVTPDKQVLKALLGLAVSPRPFLSCPHPATESSGGPGVGPPRTPAAAPGCGGLPAHQAGMGLGSSAARLCGHVFPTVSCHRSIAREPVAKWRCCRPWPTKRRRRSSSPRPAGGWPATRPIPTGPRLNAIRRAGALARGRVELSVANAGVGIALGAAGGGAPLRPGRHVRAGAADCRAAAS